MKKVKQVNNIIIKQDDSGLFYLELPLSTGKTLRGPMQTIKMAEDICRQIDTSVFVRNVKDTEMYRCICKDNETIKKDLKSAFSDLIKVEQRGNSLHILTKHGLIEMKEFIEVMSKYYNLNINNYHIEPDIFVDSYKIWFELK